MFETQLQSSLDHSNLIKLGLIIDFRTRLIFNYSPIEKRVDALES